MRVPGSPAPPRNSAHRDQPKAARTPTEIRVSMVAARCRALIAAAWWNGQAPQTATGAARVRDSHCQWRNCRAGTMASRTTGTDRTAETSSRCRSSLVSSLGARSPVASSDQALWAGGGGRVGGVAGGLDGRHQCLRVGRLWVVVDCRGLGGEVHGGGHAVQPVELALDPGSAGGAGHPADGEHDVLERSNLLADLLGRLSAHDLLLHPTGLG